MSKHQEPISEPAPPASEAEPRASEAEPAVPAPSDAADEPVPPDDTAEGAGDAEASGGDDALAQEEDDEVEEIAEAADPQAGVDAAAQGDSGPPDQEVTTERVIEAILFAADTPLTLPKIVSILGVGSARDVRKHIDKLNAGYARQGAAFRIETIAGGYQMLTLPAYNTWVRRLKQSRVDSKLSQAAMETLSVVAYKQPVVRADIEAIRGVAAGEMLNRLRELGLIKIVGRAEDVGRPMLYGTTKRFLEIFGLSGLEDLPQVEELQNGQGE